MAETDRVAAGGLSADTDSLEQATTSGDIVCEASDVVAVNRRAKGRRWLVDVAEGECRVGWLSVL